MTDLTVNPIIITGTMASAAGPDRPFPVKLVYWFNPTTSGDDFKILDGSTADNVLLEGQAEANNQSQLFKFDPPQVWPDFKVSVLTTGTLYIYF